MHEIFLEILNRSIASSWIILAVLVLRLLLKKAPKWITVLLWAVVALRLICPFGIESALSLIPSAETVSQDIMYQDVPQINSGIPAINATVNPYIGEHFGPTPYYSANPLQILIPSVASGWLLGVLGILTYALVSWVFLKQRLKTAVFLRDHIYQSESVPSPFVLGMVKPKIYLPFGMSEQEMGYVIAHEEAHIARKDHWWKPVGFLVLALHWFNPLMWVAYILLCRDIELACDEKVVSELPGEERADYSEALLSCGVDRHRIAACPLAFGEVLVKERVKFVLKYKKPAIYSVVIAVAVCMLFAGCFLTDPVNTEKNLNNMQKASVDRYPQYFGMDIKNGLDIYVWETQKGWQEYVLMPHSDAPRDLTSPEIFEQEFIAILYIQSILSIYDVAAEDIYIIPIPRENPETGYVSDYFSVLPDEGVEETENRRREYIESIRYRLLEEPYEIRGTVYDQIVADIDGDGREEECYLTHGRTSGVFSFGFYAREVGAKKWEYASTVATKEHYQTMTFAQDRSGEVYIDAFRPGNDIRGTEDEVQKVEIKLTNKIVDFYHNGEDIYFK